MNFGILVTPELVKSLVKSESEIASCWPLLTLNTLQGLSCIVLTQTWKSSKSHSYSTISYLLCSVSSHVYLRNLQLLYSKCSRYFYQSPLLASPHGSTIGMWGRENSWTIILHTFALCHSISFRMNERGCKQLQLIIDSKSHKTNSKEAIVQ